MVDSEFKRQCIQRLLATETDDGYFANLYRKDVTELLSYIERIESKLGLSIGVSAFTAHNVLDHGYVKLIETWGFGEAGESEAGIIEAARQSTQGSFRGWDKDKALLQFLFNTSIVIPANSNGVAC